MDNHYSDCGLHRGPAHRPTWCDCGGIIHPVTFLAKLLSWVRMNWLYATRQL